MSHPPRASHAREATTQTFDPPIHANLDPAAVSGREVGLPNFRDLGGLRTAGGGVVGRGRLYRSSDLSRADTAAWQLLAELGIRTVFDLRTDGERELSPEADRLPAGVRYVAQDVLRDAPDVPESRPARMMEVLADPVRSRQVLGHGGAERMFLDQYRDFVRLTSARQGYHRVLADLALPDRVPAIVHCAGGKDRAGWAIAVLLLSLGVPREAVLEDYLASNAALAPLHEAYARRYAADGGDPALIEPFMRVTPAYLEAAFDEVRRSFGSIECYIEVGLAIGPATRRRLAATFVEPH